jgi:hypothetical protein
MKRRLCALFLVVLLVGSILSEVAAADVDASFVSRHRRLLLWTAGLTAIGAGATAYGLRYRANDRFDAYTRTADPEIITTRYDEAVRLDNGAAAFFLLAEVAFVAVIYFGFFVKPAEAAAAGGQPSRARVGGDRLAAALAADYRARGGPAHHLPRSDLGLRWTPGGVTIGWRF